jgi:CRP/FNR family transcriptional regulator, cyclic AMP receptor protein
MLTARRELKHRIQGLRGLDLFASCSFAELAQIDRLGTPVDLAAGRTLTHEGAGARECFVVRDGYAVARRGGETVGAIGPGSIAGEMALLDHTTRNATVLAYTPMELLVLTDSEFKQLLRIAPGIEADLDRIVMGRRRN